MYTFTVTLEGRKQEGWKCLEQVEEADVIPEKNFATPKEFSNQTLFALKQCVFKWVWLRPGLTRA